jgi:hypothetical protein
LTSGTHNIPAAYCITGSKPACCQQLRCNKIRLLIISAVKERLNPTCNFSPTFNATQLATNCCLAIQLHPSTIQGVRLSMARFTSVQRHVHNNYGTVIPPINGPHPVPITKRLPRVSLVLRRPPPLASGCITCTRLLSHRRPSPYSNHHVATSRPATCASMSTPPPPRLAGQSWHGEGAALLNDKQQDTHKKAKYSVTRFR